MNLIERIKCPYCNNNQFKSLYKKEYDSKILTNFLTNYYNNNKIHHVLESKIYEISECTLCSGLFQKYIPDEKLSFFLYETLISNEISLQKKIELTSKNFMEFFGDASIIEDLIKKKNYNIKILEFGCGWGFWTKFMKSLNFDVETVEISTSRAEYLKKNGIKNYRNLNEINKKYDLIFSNQAIEHVSYPLNILNLLKDKLVDGGIMYHKFPSAFLFKEQLTKNYIPHKDCAHPLEHINIFNKKSFKTLCKSLNLKRVNISDLNMKHKLKALKNELIFNHVILVK